MKAHQFFVLGLLGFTAQAAHAYWPNHFDGYGLNDAALSVKVDSKQNVYVAGHSYGNGAGRDVQIVRYDRFGNLDASAVYGDFDVDEAAIRMCIDSNDNVTLLGTKKVGSFTQALVLRYDKHLSFKWAKTYNGGGDGNVTVSEIAADPFGGVVIGGFLNTGTESDCFVRRYTTGGGVAATARWGVGNSAYDTLRDIVVDSLGNTYATGRSSSPSSGYDVQTVKINSAGVVMWSKSLAGPEASYDEGNCLALNSAEEPIIAARSQKGNGTVSDFLAIKYGTGGQKLWQTRVGSYGADEQPTSLAIGASDEVVIGGNSQENSQSDFFIVKLDSVGGLVWKKLYQGDGPTSSYDTLAGIELDAEGNVYSGGTWQSSSNGKFYFIMIRTSATGHRQWSRIDSIDSGGQCLGYGMAFDPIAQRPYLTGTGLNSAAGNYDIYTVKYQ